MARRLLREWLTTWRWPREETGDVVLAASEAVTNAVEHAAATRILVDAGLDSVPDPVAESLAGFVAVASRDTARHAARADGRARRVVISVTDDGRWRTPPARGNDRHSGLALMRACMDRVELDTNGRGTRVRLTSRLAPPPTKS